jgi:hypothetical protein
LHFVSQKLASFRLLFQAPATRLTHWSERQILASFCQNEIAVGLSSYIRALVLRRSHMSNPLFSDYAAACRRTASNASSAFLRAFAKPDAGPAAILVDELDAGAARNDLRRPDSSK